jgi:hypothetical protein
MDSCIIYKDKTVTSVRKCLYKFFAIQTLNPVSFIQDRRNCRRQFEVLEPQELAFQRTNGIIQETSKSNLRQTKGAAIHPHA